jgi:carbon-monoxide dehydrogenase large subunit
VKWIETRTEHLLSSGHARDERITIQAAVRTDGTILALRVEMTMDQGAYPAFPFPAAIYTDMVGTLIPGPYRVRALSFAGTVVATNKCSYVAYRGPWEMETWVRERLIDIIARELDLDTVAVRRGNLVLGRDEDRMVTGLSLAKVSSRLSLERAVEVVDYQHLCADRDTARRSGRYLGIGLATYIEAAPGPPEYRQTGGIERATARLEPDGRLTIVTAQAPHGQGHETTLAQVAAEELGLPITHVRVVHGDTRFTPFKLVATGGSGAGPYTTGAVMKSTRALRAKILAVASHLLEIDPGDLVCTDGAAVARGVPSRRMSLADIARTAYLAPKTLPADLDASLEESHAYSLESVGSGWSGGTHVCVVEVDIETGRVEIQRWVVIEDCGRMINPTIVEGQIRGAIAQGIGEVLFERVLYDDEAQLRSATFLDYLLPTAPDVPDIEIYHLETPPADELDFRGVGEGGAIVAPAALTNAIEDALAPIGVRINEQYLPPARLAKLAGVI